MPGPFAESSFHSEASDDLQAMRDWCASLGSHGVGGPYSPCDDFVSCYELCSDYACAESCASIHLDDDLLLTTRALLRCMEEAGCLLLDQTCMVETCPDEAAGFFERCGYE